VYYYYKKACDVPTSPLLPPYTPKAACINFGMWGRLLDAINHAKSQLDRFRGFGAPSDRKSLSPIDWRYRPYTSVRTKVLHCDSGYVCTIAHHVCVLWDPYLTTKSASCHRQKLVTICHTVAVVNIVT